MIFGDKLPVLPICMGNARTTLGGLRFTKRRQSLGKMVFSDFRMIISAHYDLPEHEIEDTLIHEMIHYYILYNQVVDSAPHGQMFQQLMNGINRKYGRHITISHRSEVREEERLESIKAHYICISYLKDGNVGITVVARTRVFELCRQLPQYFPIREMKWYGSTDPYFNRFPSAIKPKMYVADEAELQEHLRLAVELVNDGHRIYPK